MCDGDKLLVIKDRLLTRIAKRNMKEIVPLAYNLKKAKGEILSQDSLYEGMSNAYVGGNIGPISNNISRVWNSENIGEEQLNVVKWLCYTNNQVIDYAKTLWLASPPKQVQDTIHKYTKAALPNFFIYAKDKLSSQVESVNNSTMNRISQAISDSRVKFLKTVNKFDYRTLMNQNCDFSVSENNPVVKSYDYWNVRQKMFNEQDLNVKDQDLYKYKQIRQKIIEESQETLDYIVNTLVAYLYTVRPNSTKKTLWACFGDVILQNIKNNLNEAEKVCPMCGKRFLPNQKAPHSVCCSIECSRAREAQKRILRRSDNVAQTLEPQGVDSFDT